MRQHKDCNFSYAGLKTQVRLAIESRNMYGCFSPCAIVFIVRLICLLVCQINSVFGMLFALLDYSILD
ncbi:hypothetical protein DAI22_01g135000 [Oryza sativa Japonica Group]|nr:hypothetical protein DAI22_01g135000 [Oryza sativa Japonica Group]